MTIETAPLIVPHIAFADGLGGLAGMQALYEFYWALGIAAAFGVLWIVVTTILVRSQHRLPKTLIVYLILSLGFAGLSTLLARMGATFGPIRPSYVAVLIVIISLFVVYRHREKEGSTSHV